MTRLGSSNPFHGAVLDCDTPALANSRRHRQPSGHMMSGIERLPQTGVDAVAAGNRRAIAVWLLVCAALILVMVVLGGVTRLTESGLSITEWQPIAGILPPLSEAAWQAEFAKYREIPQFQLVHSWMSIEDFKTIYFWEWLHRLWGRLIGIAFAVPFLSFLLRRRIPP